MYMDTDFRTSKQRIIYILYTFKHGILQEAHIHVFKSLCDGLVFFKLSDNTENALYTGFPQKHTKGIKGPMSLPIFQSKSINKIMDYFPRN